MNRTDVAVAGLVTVVALIALAIGAAAGPPQLHPLLPLSILFAMGQGLVLLWRRRAPLKVLLLSTTLVMLHGTLGQMNVSADYGPVAAVYAVAAYIPGRRAWAAAVAAAVASAALGATPVVSSGNTAELPARLATGVILFLAVFMAGRLSRSRRQAAAARLHTALSDERTRIARELHDVIAHHVGAMVVQAGAGRRLLETGGDVERARDAFAAIEHAGRTALTAVPVLVGALRGDAANTAPQPSLRRLDAIMAVATDAGVAVELDVAGLPDDLPASVELSAYRIVQEAVTNVMKHADADTISIRLRYGDGALDVTVADDGRGGTPDSAGRYGLAGMRERVSLLGGQLDAGPGAAGGFTVHASLPVARQ